MGKKKPGNCDFIYLKGDNKGKECGERGWNDKTGFRCKRHRLTKIRYWHGKRDKASPPARARFDMMREEIVRLRDILKAISSATNEANAIGPSIFVNN